MIFQTLDFTDEFRETLLGNESSRQERRLFLKALRPLDTVERHPSLRIHDLEGQRAGIWSASASSELRITFLRTDGGRKQLPAATRHYRG